jgi:hypothetical protein
MTGASRDGDDQRISTIMQIAESLAGDEVHDGYTVIGAASSGAFRFKWVAREVEDGRFIVHETVGAGTVAVSSQPMPREEVVGYISERRQRIQRRIDDVKRELAGAALVLPPVPLKQADWPRPVDPPPPVEVSEEFAPSDAPGDETPAETAFAPVSKSESAPVTPSPSAPAPAKTPSETKSAAAGTAPKTERDPEEIFEEIRRMLQESL